MFIVSCVTTIWTSHDRGSYTCIITFVSYTLHRCPHVRITRPDVVFLLGRLLVNEKYFNKCFCHFPYQPTNSSTSLNATQCPVVGGAVLYPQWEDLVTIQVHHIVVCSESHHECIEGNYNIKDHGYSYVIWLTFSAQITVYKNTDILE